MSRAGFELGSALSERLRAVLRCPVDHGRLADAGEQLLCERCGTNYSIDPSGTLILLRAADRSSSAFGFYDSPAGGRHGRDAGEMPDELVNPVLHFLNDAGDRALVLEVGSGRGAFDGAAPGLVQLDISRSALAELGGARIQASATALPFAAASLDAVFTVAALEHVPDPAMALAEIDRVLRPGGSALVYPAWFVRPWTAQALHLRPFAELKPADRLRKLTIPIRDRREYQLATRLPRRVASEVAIMAGRKVPFRYRRLEPNLEQYLTSDSDAFSSMDPHAVSAYFVSRGYRDLGRAARLGRLAYAYEPVRVRKPSA